MTRESAAAGAHASTATVAVPGASDVMFAPRAAFEMTHFRPVPDALKQAAEMQRRIALLRERRARIAFKEADAIHGEMMRDLMVQIDQDIAYNVVAALGKNDLLDKYFRGSSYTAAWYCMLISSTPTVASTNTMSSHAWTEVGGTNAPAYSGARPSLTFANAASAGSLATSSASSFTFTSGGTVGGMAATTNPTKDNTGGLLYNAAAFTGNDRAVVSNDVVNVSVTYTIT